ncbi:MAG: SDR family NAD(P)-dependent oxidoreductase [Cyclobacteriaceae bacterium]
MEFSLKNKVILVTGGSRGIGAAAVRALAASGARVACQYQNSEKPARELSREFPDKVELFKCALHNEQEVLKLIPSVTEKMGPIDVLINNAGVAIQSPLSGSDEDWMNDWNMTIRVNLTSAALLCRAVIPVFKNRGGGIIINVSSRAAHRGDTEDYLAYAASKGGMEALTKSLARAFGKAGVTVFGIAPGFTRTSMAQDFIDLYGEEYASSDIALNMLTEPEDISPFFVFLASGRAAHATGSTIDVNAGSYVR